jgi:hypothetical protein
MYWTTSLISPRHIDQGWNWHHGLGASRPTTWLPGFVGPVPPPLWIRACSVFNCGQIITQTGGLVKSTNQNQGGAPQARGWLESYALALLALLCYIMNSQGNLGAPSQAIWNDTVDAVTK